MNEQHLKKELERFERQKTEIVTSLVSMMKSGVSPHFINQIGFTLVDNFRDERIEECLVELIKQPHLKNYNGTLLLILMFSYYSSIYLKLYDLNVIKNSIGIPINKTKNDIYIMRLFKALIPALHFSKSA